jgi:hypothetical protein
MGAMQNTIRASRTINVNNAVRVRLTDDGLRRYIEVRDRVCEHATEEARAMIHKAFADKLNGRVLTTGLWQLFQDFGPVMSMTRPIPFDNNEIEVLP